MGKTGCGILLITRDERRVLLLQRGASAPAYPSHWGGPGGIQDPSDTDEVSAALRELREETGIQLHPSETLPFYEGVWEEGDGRRLVYFLTCIPLVIQVTLSWEHSDSGWFTYEEALSVPLAFHYDRAIRKLRADAIL